VSQFYGIWGSEMVAPRPSYMSQAREEAMMDLVHSHERLGQLKRRVAKGDHMEALAFW